MSQAPRYVARGCPGDLATWWYVLDRRTGRRDPVGHGPGPEKIARERAARLNARGASRAPACEICDGTGVDCGAGYPRPCPCGGAPRAPPSSAKGSPSRGHG